VSDSSDFDTGSIKVSAQPSSEKQGTTRQKKKSNSEKRILFKSRGEGKTTNKSASHISGYIYILIYYIFLYYISVYIYIIYKLYIHLYVISI
jgi:hypothetical protein